MCMHPLPTHIILLASCLSHGFHILSVAQWWYSKLFLCADVWWTHCYIWGTVWNPLPDSQNHDFSSANEIVSSSLLPLVTVNITVMTANSCSRALDQLLTYQFGLFCFLSRAPVVISILDIPARFWNSTFRWDCKSISSPYFSSWRWWKGLYLHLGSCVVSVLFSQKKGGKVEDWRKNPDFWANTYLIEAFLIERFNYRMNFANIVAAFIDPLLLSRHSIYLLISKIALANGIVSPFLCSIVFIWRWWKGFTPTPRLMCSICSCQPKRKKKKPRTEEKKTLISEPTFDCNFPIWTPFHITELHLLRSFHLSSSALPALCPFHSHTERSFISEPSLIKNPSFVVKQREPRRKINAYLHILKALPKFFVLEVPMSGVWISSWQSHWPFNTKNWVVVTLLLGFAILSTSFLCFYYPSVICLMPMMIKVAYWPSLMTKLHLFGTPLSTLPSLYLSV